MTATPKMRTKVPCLDVARCKTRWHWSDTTPLCGATSSTQRKPVDSLVSLKAPRLGRRNLTDVVDPGEGIVLDFSEESWGEFSRACASVHGLQVNRHALTNVVEIATRGDSRTSDLDGADEELAFEVLCLDSEVREAVIHTALGPGLAADRELVENATEDFERLLARMHNADAPNEDTPTLDAFPVLRARVAGLVDASYEAQKRMHAYDAMAQDITRRLYLEHASRIDGKFLVRGNRAIAFTTAAQRPGDVVIKMSTSRGLYDANAAKEDMTDEEWAAALTATADHEIAITPAALRAEAKKRDISIEPFLSQVTSQVDLMTAYRDEVDPMGDVPFEKDSKTSKADGVAEYRAGVSKFGSHFYVPDTSGMDEERAFATLVNARARADLRRAEAKEVSAVLKASMRKIEPLAVNATLRYEDSGRDYLFQVNKTTEFDRDTFEEAYPEVLADLRTARRTSGKVTPSKRAIQEALSATREDAAGVVDNYRKPSTSRPLVRVVGEDGKAAEPSKIGRASAEARIGRGEALNGRVMTENFDS